MTNKTKPYKYTDVTHRKKTKKIIKVYIPTNISRHINRLHTNTHIHTDDDCQLNKENN